MGNLCEQGAFLLFLVTKLYTYSLEPLHRQWDEGKVSPSTPFVLSDTPCNGLSVQKVQEGKWAHSVWQWQVRVITAGSVSQHTETFTAHTLKQNKHMKYYLKRGTIQRSRVMEKVSGLATSTAGPDLGIITHNCNWNRKILHSRAVLFLVQSAPQGTENNTYCTEFWKLVGLSPGQSITQGLRSKKSCFTDLTFSRSLTLEGQGESAQVCVSPCLWMCWKWETD